MSRVKFTQTIQIRPFGTVRDAEGGVTASYIEPGYHIQASIQPKTRGLVHTPAGDRVGATMVGYADRMYCVREKDGVCLEGESAPSYYVSAVDTYSTHIVFELQKVVL